MDDDIEHIKRTLEPSQELRLPLEEKDAGVLVLLRGTKPNYEVLLTVRSVNLRKHPGEVCFPGGMFEEIDGNLQETARREAEEEVGIRREEMVFLGCLPPFRARFGVLVHPCVALLRDDVNFIPSCNPGEVSRVFWAPLSTFISEKGHNSYVLDNHYTVHGFDFDEAHVFGLTAYISVVVSMCLLEKVPEFDISETFTSEAMQGIGTKHVVATIFRISSLPIDTHGVLLKQAKI